MRKGVRSILEVLADGGTHVYPVHAEVEGGGIRDAFVAILQGALDLGYRIPPLSEIAAACKKENLPERAFRISLLKGRAFPCAV